MASMDFTRYGLSVYTSGSARVAELVDAADSKSAA